MTKNQAQNFYQILDVPRSADSFTIKKKYLQLVGWYHPDKNPGQKVQMTKRMQRINAAYAVLNDKEKRAAYDASLCKNSVINVQPKNDQPVGNSSNLRNEDKPKETGLGTFARVLGFMGGSLLIRACVWIAVSGSGATPQHSSTTITPSYATNIPASVPAPTKWCNSCVECQQGLVNHGYNIGVTGADGICGPLTKAAWHQCYLDRKCINDM